MAQEQPNHYPPQDTFTRATPEERSRPGMSVGDQLRIARERRGQGIFEIADYLRIKADYLNALERGAYDRLPAHAYAVGFLRSYADYLGLDSMMVLAAYRLEVAGKANTPQLLMPQPLPEGKMPHLLLILGGVLFAIGVYAIWYFSIDRAVPASPTTISASESPEPSSGVASTTVPGNSLEAIPLATTPTQLEAHALQQALSAGTEPEDISAKSTSQPEPVKNPEPSKSSEPTKNADKPVPSTRVVIRAIHDSSVTLTDAKGKTLFSRTMTAGTVYQVPDGSGYKLTTANAGGIVITVDGKDLPKFGNTGQTLRDIALDPDVLSPKVR